MTLENDLGSLGNRPETSEKRSVDYCIATSACAVRPPSGRW
jgi:hypothetical protein